MNAPDVAGESGDTPAGRIEKIQTSLHIVQQGALSLIPVVGLGFAVSALRFAVRVQRSRREQWNPGSRCVVTGMVLALVGSVLSVAWIVFLLALWFG